MTSRNEGVDGTHAPEFTMVEAYEGPTATTTRSPRSSELVQKTAKDVFGSSTVTLLDGARNTTWVARWKTMSMYDSLSGSAWPGDRAERWSRPPGHVRRGTRPHRRQNSVWNATTWRTTAKLVEHLWEHFYEDKLYEPTFVRDFPVETCRLSRRTAASRASWRSGTLRAWLRAGHRLLRSSTTRIVQRANASWHRPRTRSPATKRRATSTRTSSRRSAWACHRPAAWAWMGIDRLLIALTGATIRETITFPLVKPLNG